VLLLEDRSVLLLEENAASPQLKEEILAKGKEVSSAVLSCTCILCKQ
jgi:hypothetical protein